MKTVDVATARRVMNLFGPGTATFEWLSPDEIAEQVNKIGGLRKWVEFQFDCEEIDLEEDGNSAGTWNWWKGIKKRVENGLKELGL